MLYLNVYNYPHQYRSKHMFTDKTLNLASRCFSIVTVFFWIYFYFHVYKKRENGDMTFLDKVKQNLILSFGIFTVMFIAYWIFIDFYLVTRIFLRSNVLCHIWLFLVLPVFVDFTDMMLDIYLYYFYYIKANLHFGYSIIYCIFIIY